MADEKAAKEKPEKNAKNPVLVIYEESGMQGIIDALGLSPRQVLSEVQVIAERQPALPEAGQVFAAFDEAAKKAGGDKLSPVVPVLALMGLKKDDLAPGSSPWSLRPNEDGKDVLTLSLGTGKKVAWVRPDSDKK